MTTEKIIKINQWRGYAPGTNHGDRLVHFKR